MHEVWLYTALEFSLSKAGFCEHGNAGIPYLGGISCKSAGTKVGRCTRKRLS